MKKDQKLPLLSGFFSWSRVWPWGQLTGEIRFNTYTQGLALGGPASEREEEKGVDMGTSAGREAGFTGDRQAGVWRTDVCGNLLGWWDLQRTLLQAPSSSPHPARALCRSPRIVLFWARHFI